MSISNLTATSYQKNLGNDEGVHDEFDLNLENDTVETLLKNDDDITALAEAIIDDADLPKDMLEELVEFIKIQAKNAPKEISIQTFMTSVITDLQTLAGNDASLSVDELNTGIIQEQKQVNEAELVTFISDVLTSIAGENGTLEEKDAPLLAALLNINEKLAKDLISDTSGDIDGLISVFAGQNGDSELE